MSYYVGADLGNLALKLIMLDSSKNIVKTVTKSYDVSYPKHGWSEQNPETWWEAFILGMKDLRENINKEEVSGIAVAGQMHGLVVLDENDRVIRPAILWNNCRCDKEVDYLNEVIRKEKNCLI